MKAGVTFVTHYIPTPYECVYFLFIAGETFKYFPKNAHLIIVDRNAYVCQFLQSDLGRRRLDHLHVEKVYVEHAENMNAVPTESVDAVVATRVLCSSRNVPRLLAQIQRVLAPVRP